MNGLFRAEVLHEQHKQWLGTVNLATPLSFILWALLALALAAAIVLLLVFGHYTRRENVAGQLVPASGLLSNDSKVEAQLLVPSRAVGFLV